MFQQWSTLGDFRTVSDVLTNVGLNDEAWEGWLRHIGPLGNDLRILASLPAVAVVAAVGQAVKANGDALNPVEATQVGLAWRTARRVLAMTSGMDEAQFVDVDPWAPTVTGVLPPAAKPAASGVKEHVLKMAALVDQSDESELMPPSMEEVHTWTQNFVLVMGAMPDDVEEPTPNQLAALNKRVVKLLAAPYVDFAVWSPFERRAAKTHRFRVFTPLGNGQFLQRDLPGPGNFMAWSSSWRVFRAAAIMLKICSLAALEAYFRHVERLVTQWPQCWGLIYSADDTARAEKLEKWRRHWTLEQSRGRQVPGDWDANDPWSCVFHSLIGDEKYWSEKVHIPAAAWLASGGKGVPVVAGEAAVTSQFPGLREESDDDRPVISREAKREKRIRKRRKVQADLQELKHLKAANEKTADRSNFQPKGKGKSKSKDQSGAPICFSWAANHGSCANVPPGDECKGSIKRAHKCRKCLSPSHQDKDCKAWPWETLLFFCLRAVACLFGVCFLWVAAWWNCLSFCLHGSSMTEGGELGVDWGGEDDPGHAEASPPEPEAKKLKTQHHGTDSTKLQEEKVLPKEDKEGAVEAKIPDRVMKALLESNSFEEFRKQKSLQALARLLRSERRPCYGDKGRGGEGTVEVRSHLTGQTVGQQGGHEWCRAT